MQVSMKQSLTSSQDSADTTFREIELLKDKLLSFKRVKS